MEKLTMDERETAESVGISLSKLRADRQHKRGIPFVKVGKRVLYRVSDIKQFLEHNRIDTTA